MKRQIRLSIFVILALIFVFGTFAGCTGGKKEETDSLLPQSLQAWEGGTHEISVSEGSHDLIRGGVSEYTVVIPQDASATVSKAATELVSYVETASGVTLEIVKEPQAKTEKILSVGSTQAAEQAGVLDAALSQKLGELGVRILTKGANAYMTGNTGDGVLYSVYTWLHYQFGFEAYGVDEIALLSDVTDLKLKEMDIVDVPDIPYSQSTYGFTDYNPSFREKMRIPDMIFMSVGGDAWHNSFDYIDPVTYKHKKSWFSTDGTQLCYTAHSDEAQLSEMVDVVTTKIKMALADNPDKTHITLTHEDTATWCTCSACTQMKEKYGTDAASVIRFCNSVSRAINAWFETSDGKPYKRDLQIAFFAYHATEAAPVTYDEQTKSYVPVDETVVCDENVGVIYAPISATYQRDFSAEYNQDYKKVLDGWCAVTDKLYMWTYNTNFHYYLVPTNTYNSLQSNYRLWAQSGATWLMDQGQYNNPQSTGFSALKVYLNTKLRWNVNEDMEALIDEFFSNYFGPAAQSVRKYFDEFRAHSLYLENEMGYLGNCYLEPLDQRYWPKTLLERWIGYCEEALAELEPLKEKDENLYNMYSENVILESISPRFLLLDLWSNRFGESELKEMRNSFRADCMACEVTQYAEKVPLSDLWSQWGI